MMCLVLVVLVVVVVLLLLVRVVDALVVVDVLVRDNLAELLSQQIVVVSSTPIPHSTIQYINCNTYMHVLHTYIYYMCMHCMHH